MDTDVLIVGGGPAGSAAAIRLANRAPELAARTLLVDKARFPRKKLCGGGVTQHGWDLLRELDVTLDVPSFPVHQMRIVYRELEARFRWRNLFHVVQRDEFDAALLETARERGVRICEGNAVRAVNRAADKVTLVTEQGEVSAQVVIAADGANSLVRQKLGFARADRISRLLEVLTPVQEPLQAPEFTEHTAVFDFTPIARGVQGYYWDFPAFRNGKPVMNRGLFDARVRPDRERAELKPALDEELQARGLTLADVHLMGHPERWFDPKEPHAAPRIVLAGDAAGVDPWLGEGISHALDFGTRAADSVIDAFRSGDYSFADYSQKIAASALGRRLRLKRFIAHYVYGNRSDQFYRFGWRLLQTGLPLVARR